MAMTMLERNRDIIIDVVDYECILVGKGNSMEKGAKE
jgi:hypothetical protein